MKSSSSLIANIVTASTIIAGASSQIALAQAPTEPATQLPTVEVTASSVERSYAPAEATSATKTDTPLKDLPASVQVVPKELLQDRGVTRVSQMVDNVSGVHAESSYGGNGATFFNIRGFTTSNSLRDGFRNYGYFTYRDVQAIERVEVLKGPAGALYGGVGSVGGYINTVSKRPHDIQSGEFSITSGSYGLLRPTLDWNQPLGEDVSFRINSAYEHNDGYRDRSGYDAFAIAPSIKWDISDDTTLLVLLEYNRLERDAFDFGVPNLPGYTSFPRKGYYGLPHDYGVNETYSASVIFEHEFNDNWKLRLGGHYTFGTQDSTQTFPDNYLYAGGDILPFTSYLDVSEEATDFSVQAELLGSFETGPIKHSLLVGTEYSYLNDGGSPNDRYTFNMSLSHPGRITEYGYSSTSGGVRRAQAQTFGLYLSDLIELTPQWKILLGAREDWFFNETQTWQKKTVQEADEARFSSRAGLVWQPVEATSLYFSYGKSYIPNINHSSSNTIYDAEKGEQFEVGIKQELIKDRLSANLAVYDLTREGVLVSDPTNPENLIQTGERRSRGIELDLAGEIAPGWKIITSYAYTDTEVISDTVLPVGQPLSNVPLHSGSIWSTYQFQSGALKGFGFGAGLYYVGDREANLPNTYELPAYWRTDATVFYERDNWKFQVNLLNVFDRDYYTGGEAGSFNYTLDPSQPFSVQATITYKF